MATNPTLPATSTTNMPSNSWKDFILRSFNSILTMDVHSLIYWIFSIALWSYVAAKYQTHHSPSSPYNSHSVLLIISAALSIGSSIPLIVEILLDINIHSKIQGYISIRSMIPVSLIIFFSITLNSNLGNSNQGNISFDKLLLDIGFDWVIFTSYFSLTYLIIKMDSLSIFTNYRMIALLLLYALSIVFRYFFAAYPEENTAFLVASIFLYSCFYLFFMMCLVAWTFKLVSIHSARPEDCVFSINNYKDYCCLALVIAVFIVTTNQFIHIYIDNSHYLYFLMFSLIHLSAVVFGTVLPGRMIRSIQVESEATNYRSAWVGYFSHEMRTPIGIVALYDYFI
jgi:hypothetical protein